MILGNQNEFYYHKPCGDFISVRCTLEMIMGVPYLTATTISGASAPGVYQNCCLVLCR